MEGDLEVNIYLCVFVILIPTVAKANETMISESAIGGQLRRREAKVTLRKIYSLYK